jgi:hypothetical protein
VIITAPAKETERRGPATALWRLDSRPKLARFRQRSRRAVVNRPLDGVAAAGRSGEDLRCAAS